VQQIFVAACPEAVKENENNKMDNTPISNAILGEETTETKVADAPKKEEVC
jgi:hypothetical protein